MSKSMGYGSSRNRYPATTFQEPKWGVSGVGGAIVDFTAARREHATPAQDYVAEIDTKASTTPPIDETLGGSALDLQVQIAEPEPTVTLE